MVIQGKLGLPDSLTHSEANFQASRLITDASSDEMLQLTAQFRGTCTLGIYLTNYFENQRNVQY